MQRFEMLRSSRGPWESHWQEVGDVVWPDAGQFLGTTTEGTRRNQKVFDATATLALENFSAALLSLMMPAGLRWHRLKVAAPELADDPDVQAWCDQATTMWAARTLWNNPSEFEFCAGTIGPVRVSLQRRHPHHAAAGTPV